jgi:hypothetical protein
MSAHTSEESHGEICESDPCTMCDGISSGLAAVAQSLINISEGLTTIEKGSQLYSGMELLMEPRLAALVRAAPDLLEALKQAIALVENYDRMGPLAVPPAWRALVAKAGAKP